MRMLHVVRKAMLLPIICMLIFLMGIFSPTYAHPAAQPTLSIPDIQKQSVVLYQHLRHQQDSQAQIDAAMLQQFGLQRMSQGQAGALSATLFDSTNQDVSLPAATLYSTRGYTFTYADFDWGGCAAYCHGDALNYTDDFGMLFTQNVPVGSTYLEVTNLDDSSSYYQNPTDFNQGGADFSESANNWESGTLEISWKGGFPPGCTELLTQYTHGWSSNAVSVVQISTGDLPGPGISVTYSSAYNSWQAMGGTLAHHGC